MNFFHKTGLGNLSKGDLTEAMSLRPSGLKYRTVVDVAVLLYHPYGCGRD
jgi:hypothetical protein